MNLDVLREFDLSKPPVTYNFNPKRENIVVLGDSYTDGGVRKDQTYSAFLSHLINMNIINTGIMGINTKMEVERLKKIGLKYKPKIVIIQYCDNDVQNPYIFWSLVYNIFKKLDERGIHYYRHPLFLKINNLYNDEVFLKNPKKMLYENDEVPFNELYNLSKQYNFSVIVMTIALPKFQQDFIRRIVNKYNWSWIDLKKELGWKFEPPYTISKTNCHFSVSYNKKVAKLLKEKIKNIIK